MATARHPRFTSYLFPPAAALIGAVIGNRAGGYAHYLSAYQVEALKPRTEWDMSAHLDALRDALRYGEPHGEFFGAVVAFLVAGAMVRRGFGWLTIPAAIAAGAAAAAIGGYLRV